MTHLPSNKVVCSALMVLAVSLANGCEADDPDTIGARGGTVVSDDGRLVLDVPAGALSREVHISIGLVEGCVDGSVRCYELEPAGVSFELPATLTYYPALKNGDRIDLDDLSIVVQRGSIWRPTADRRIDDRTHSVSASAFYLSSYAVLAP